MHSGLVRTAAIVLAIVAGTFCPQVHVLTWSIRWLVMGMLFLVFLGTPVERVALHRTHGWLLIANVTVAFVGWFVGWFAGGRDVALAVFFAGIAPTAAAAPVVMSFLGGRVEYVVAAFIVTNLGISALLPLILPIVLGHASLPDFIRVFGSVALVVFAPLLMAMTVRRLHPPARSWPAELRNASFAAWVISIFILTGNASDFLRRETNAPHSVIGWIVALTIGICATNFALGRLLGRREFAREASQSLGQKNTTFTIYLALAHAGPIAALGPTFYIVWHNLWNSWQLRRAPGSSVAKADRSAPRADAPIS